MDIFGHWAQEAQEAQEAEGKHLMQLLPTPYSPFPTPYYLIPCYTRPFISCPEKLSLILDKIRKFSHVKARQSRIHFSLKYVSRV